MVSQVKSANLARIFCHSCKTPPKKVRLNLNSVFYYLLSQCIYYLHSEYVDIFAHTVGKKHEIIRYATDLFIVMDTTGCSVRDSKLQFLNTNQV